MSDRSAPTLELRLFREADFDAVVRLWHETKRAAYPYLPTEQARSREEDAGFFRERILPRCAVWIAETDGAPVGFLALADSYVDRLYVHPAHQRRGVGSLLLRKALELSSAGVELHTHQQNVSARAFYEKHGFRAVRFGTSPPPESAPDVEYHWRP